MHQRTFDIGASGEVVVIRWILKLLAAWALSALCIGPDVMTAQNTVENFGDLSAAAASAREQGDIPQAVELYRRAVQVNPSWPDGWWYLGTLEYGAGDYAPATEALSRYIELTPKAGPALALRGLCEFELGQYPHALQDL